MEENRIGRIADVTTGVIRALDRVCSSDIDWQYPYPLDSGNRNMLRQLHPIERSCSRLKRKRAAPLHVLGSAQLVKICLWVTSSDSITKFSEEVNMTIWHFKASHSAKSKHR